MITVSDSQPIQFWTVTEGSSLSSDNYLVTFNETTVYGLAKQDCFCQPLLASDEVTIQYYGGEEGKIWIRYSDGTYSGTYINFTDVTPYIHQVTPYLCDYFPLASWVDGGSPDPMAGISATSLGAVTTSLSSAKWTLPIKIPSGKRIRFSISNNVFLTPGFDSGYVLVQIGDGSTFAFQQSTTYTSTNNYSMDVDITTTVESNQIKILFFAVSGTFTCTTTLPTSMIWPDGPISLEIRRLGNDVIMAKSDCIDIRESWPVTKQIEYSNATNFDNLYYENGSPGPYFYLRVQAMFYESKNPQEQEDLELSNGQVVTLRSSIQQKRLLETGFMPDYMHLKLQKILMHDTIIIDGTYWKKRDSYDDSPIKKYNLKRAQVYLTKYDSVEKNTI